MHVGMHQNSIENKWQKKKEKKKWSWSIFSRWLGHLLHSEITTLVKDTTASRYVAKSIIVNGIVWRCV